MSLTRLQLMAALVPAVLFGPNAAAVCAPRPAPAIKRLGRSTIRTQGVQVFAAAYFDRDGGYPVTSRYAVQIKSTPPGPLHWDLDNPAWGLDAAGGSQGVIGQESATPYRHHQRQALITCRLRQYDTLEERVTFHKLTLVRLFGFGFLTVSEPQTATTPSGITVTLPVQNQETFMPGGTFVYGGPPDVVFARIGLSPGAARVTLPASALYRRHSVPVSLRVDTAKPVFMNSNSGSGAWTQITMTLPDSKATRFDSLTLIVRQRAELQSIPLTFRVPITRRVPEKLFAGLGG